MEHPRLRRVSIAPGPPLQPFIERFLVVEYLSGHATTLLPGSGAVAAFRFRGNALINGIRAANTMLTGIWDTSRTLVHNGSCSNVLAMFTPAGAASFFREPAHQFFNTVHPLEFQVRRSHLDLVEEQVAEASHHRQRIHVIEQFLLQRLRPGSTDPLISATIARIRALHGSLRIANLAQFTGLSQSALERRFRRHVGISPKKFAAITRLRHVVQLHRDGHSLTEIAYRAGYADQSHLIKDFKNFAGQAPQTFFQSPHAFC